MKPHWVQEAHGRNSPVAPCSRWPHSRRILGIYRGTTGTGTPGYDLYIDDVVVTDITDAKEAQDSANSNASALTSLTSRVTNVEGQVTSQASQLSSLTSQVNDASSKVDQMAQTITNNEKTQSSLNTSLQSQIDAQASANIKNQTELNNATTSMAAIKSTQQTQATTISALSQQQTNLTAQVGGQSAELQELKKTVVENGNVNSTWMVKMETNSNGKKYAAGIALGIDGKNLQSQFLVQADRFGLINTSNGNTTTPFVIENGVAYINAAVIKDGSITNAKIGGEIRSDNFVNGSNGWRIGKDGSSQFNNAIFRGHIEARSGTFKGTLEAQNFIGDIAVARRYADLSFRRNNTVQRDGRYQNRGYGMTIVLSCTLIYQVTGGNEDRNGYIVEMTFNVGGQEVTRRFPINPRMNMGSYSMEFRFAADIPGNYDNVPFFVRARGRDATWDYQCYVENITATAFRTNSNSFS